MICKKRQKYTKLQKRGGREREREKRERERETEKERERQWDRETERQQGKNMTKFKSWKWYFVFKKANLLGVIKKVLETFLIAWQWYLVLPKKYSYHLNAVCLSLSLSVPLCLSLSLCLSVSMNNALSCYQPNKSSKNGQKHYLSANFNFALKY